MNRESLPMMSARTRLPALVFPLRPLSGVWVGWGVLTGFLACGPVAAQPTEPAAAGVSSPATGLARVRGFVVEGDNPLTAGEEALALAPFLRAELTLDTLQKATAALEAALQKKGHTLHRVVMPPQEVTETLTLKVVHFSVGQVEVAGASHFGQDNIRRSLPELQEGGTPFLGLLAVQTALANENPSKQVQVALRASQDDPDLIDATVRVKDSAPLQLSVNLSNTGSSASGRDRLTVSGGHANVFDRDHQFLAAYTTSLSRPGDVRQLGLTYRVPLYGLGGMVDASYTRSTVVGQFGTFSSTGAGHTWGMSYTHHYGTAEGLTRFAVLGWEDKVFDAAELNGVSLVGQQQRRSRPLTLSYKARRQGDASYWDAGVSLAVNLPTGRGNDLTSYQTERPAITTARWAALRAQAGRVDGWGSGWLLGWRMQAQWSPTALIAGEQFGVGGVGSLRGAGERVLAGDSGLSTSVELSSPEWTTGLRSLLFVDAGWLHSRQATGSLAPVSDSAASVGVGLRLARAGFVLALDYGRIVQGSRMPAVLNPNAPQRGDHKIHLNLSARF